ncbi:MAG: hypothetical protein K9G60_05395 [Pseudolabrys sp.]|nr:hypothetical protein [Pseudolabrys sp.]
MPSNEEAPRPQLKGSLFDRVLRKKHAVVLHRNRAATGLPRLSKSLNSYIKTMAYSPAGSGGGRDMPERRANSEQKLPDSAAIAGF